MPEGPEVRIVSEWLGDELKDQEIINLHIYAKSPYAGVGIDGMDELKYPLRIQKIDCHGKKIHFHCCDREETVVYLVSQLGLEGRWTWERGSNSGFAIVLKNKRKLWFDDSRHFGRFKVTDQLNTSSVDLLAIAIQHHDGVEVGLESLIDLFHSTCRRTRSASICRQLLEQKHFSGIGNYLRAEILFAIGMNPHKLACSLSRDDCSEIIRTSIDIIYRAYKSNGLTIRTFYNPDGKTGRFECRVYNHSNVNGLWVDKVNDPKDRKIHYVPAFQLGRLPLRKFLHAWRNS